VDEADAVLVVGVIGRHVGEADRVVDAFARLPDDRHDVVTGRQLAHRVACFLDDPEALVAEHEEVITGRGGTVLPRVDLAVGAVEPDAEDLYQHATTIGDRVDARLRDVREVCRVRLTWVDRYRLHPASPFHIAGRSSSEPLISTCF
jgi:hypothetical protein